MTTEPPTTPARTVTPRVLVGVAVAVVVLVVAGLLVLRRGGDPAVQGSAPPAVEDLSTGIEGIETASYPAGVHASLAQRVAYDQRPSMGGPHAPVWAACTGIVYPVAIREEYAVHSLEHGAVWITYDPERLTPQQVAVLAEQVAGRPYTLMSPYPGQPTAVSLQGWGRQLALDDPTDPRVARFVETVRLNPVTNPEPGATCDASSLFDPADPPPFDPSPPGPGAMQVDGSTVPG